MANVAGVGELACKTSEGLRPELLWNQESPAMLLTISRVNLEADMLAAEQASVDGRCLDEKVSVMLEN